MMDYNSSALKQVQHPDLQIKHRRLKANWRDISVNLMGGVINLIPTDR